MDDSRNKPAASDGSAASLCSLPDDPTVDEVYEDFWKPIIERDGVLDIEQLKKELFDFWQVMERVPKVYCHVTGDQVSKLLTDADTVCNLADEHYERMYDEAT